MSAVTIFNMESVGVHSEPELLWQNDSYESYPPNGVSQTISLDLTQYKVVLIQSTKYDVRYVGGMPDNGGTSGVDAVVIDEVSHYVINDNDETKRFSLGLFSNAFYRPVVVTNAGVTIHAAVVINSTYPDATEPDKKYIPSKIYGIR